jgi:hypothetical protein
MATEHEPRSPGEKSPIIPPDPLVADPVVERLVPDPSQPPTPTVSLLGLLGRSTKEGYWRLYFSTELNRYAEFKEEDVLHSLKVPRAQPPFLGMEATRVWIRADAEIEYTRHESRRVQAKVLQGDLAARSPINPPDDGVRMTPIDPPDGTESRGVFAARKGPIDGPPELLLRFSPINPPDPGMPARMMPIDLPDETALQGVFAAKSPIDGPPELLLQFMPSVPKPIPEPI